MLFPQVFFCESPYGFGKPLRNRSICFPKKRPLSIESLWANPAYLIRRGAPPPEVQRLLNHSKIRVLAHQYRIRTVKLESGLAGDSGYVVFEYVSQPLMDKLREKLRKQSRDIRFTEDRHAYAPMPENLSRHSDPDEVLKLVLELLGE